MLAFVRQALKDIHHTGSVWPSSPQLAKVMTRNLRAAHGPRRVLEVGPGTGPFTKHILKTLRKGDEFHLVEISNEFCEHLERELLGPFRTRRTGADVHLHCAPIEKAPLTGVFDFIVCGLPFNNFPPTLVRSILNRLMTLLREGGELAYFEYAGVRAMKAPFVNPNGRERLRRIDALGKSLRRKHSGRREFVLGNLPPAFAVRLTGGKRA
ncbi:MAG: methyltransferase domain-containing protein [Phycisphaerae bacterium]|jgi:phosphatidylethanolamine/phosphatidyl-N-methylethanolamine N-methyltransferase|nr:methyltransferase domain-containing protein [Phycisphaerae bacterium]